MSFAIDKVEETVRTGKILTKKCEKPNKLCFFRYYGKENQTYTAIGVCRKYFIEVITTWLKKGR